MQGLRPTPGIPNLSLQLNETRVVSCTFNPEALF